MTTQTTHRIANLEPADYEFIDAIDTKPVSYPGVGTPVEVWAQQREQQRIMMDELRALVAPYTLSNCTHCGAGLRYVVILEHASGQHIVVGETCYTDRFGHDNRVSLLLFNARKRAAAAAAREKISTAAMRWIDANEEVWDMMLAMRDTDQFMLSLSQAVMKYGQLTARQQVAAENNLEKYREWTTTGATCELRTEDRVTEALVEGRYTIEGEVVSTKTYDDDFGGFTVKMLVKMDSGHKVFGTVPRSIQSELGLKGNRVRFDAKVTRKESDFGYFSRPTKGEVIS